MPYVKMQVSPSGGNTGSSGGAVNYLDKENEGKDLTEKEYFFNDKEEAMTKKEAIAEVDHDKKGLGKNDAKFYSVTYAFSEAELKGKTDAELKKYIKDNFTKDYAKSVKGREIKPESIKYVAKLERERHYKGTDKEVKEGKAKQGEFKSGDNRHVHILVSRKTEEGKKVSPLTNHKGASKGNVKTGFDRNEFKVESEKNFDKTFKYERKPHEKVSHLLKVNEMKKTAQHRRTEAVKIGLDKPKKVFVEERGTVVMYRDEYKAHRKQEAEKLNKMIDKLNVKARPMGIEYSKESKRLQHIDKESLQEHKTIQDKSLDNINETARQMERERSRERDNNKNQGLSR